VFAAAASPACAYLDALLSELSEAAIAKQIHEPPTDDVKELVCIAFKIARHLN
jgi:hypothetical protein